MFAVHQAGARLRATALLAVGALAVHQLRYALAYGPRPDGSATDEHAYLHLLGPLLLAAAAATVIVSVLAPAVRRRLPRLSDPASSTERAAGYAIALLAIFFGQELLEAVLSDAPDGLLQVVAAPAAWMVLPLAMLFGAFAEAASHLLERAEVRIATALRQPRLHGQARQRRPISAHLTPLCSRPLAFGLGRRPPPLPA